MKRRGAVNSFRCRIGNGFSVVGGGILALKVKGMARGGNVVNGKDSLFVNCPVRVFCKCGASNIFLASTRIGS